LKTAHFSEYGLPTKGEIEETAVSSMRL
jgi:hypothetical protein